jgi:hypothetical protein
MALIKYPIQIYIDERQDKALRLLAKQRKISVSELIRRAIDLLLSQVTIENDPAFQLIGLGKSGISNIAENHDDYLVRSIERESL